MSILKYQTTVTVILCIIASIAINVLLFPHLNGIYDHTPQALRGFTGEQGPQGIQGERGVQGISGVNGTDGINGTTPIFPAKPVAYAWYDYEERVGADRYVIHGFVVNLGLNNCSHVIVDIYISAPNAWDSFAITIWFVGGQDIVRFTDEFYLDGSGEATYFDVYVTSWMEIE